MGLAALLQLINVAVPGIENVVLLIKNESGSTTAILSTTATQNATDQATIQTWLTQHQAPAAAKAS